MHNRDSKWPGSAIKFTTRILGNMFIDANSVTKDPFGPIDGRTWQATTGNLQICWIVQHGKKIRRIQRVAWWSHNVKWLFGYVGFQEGRNGVIKVYRQSQIYMLNRFQTGIDESQLNLPTTRVMIYCSIFLEVAILITYRLKEPASSILFPHLSSCAWSHRREAIS